MGVADETVLERGSINCRLRALNSKNCAIQSLVNLADPVHYYFDDDIELRSCGHDDYEFVQNTFDEAHSPEEEFFYALQGFLQHNTEQEYSIMEIVKVLIDASNQDSTWICKASDLNLRRNSLRKLIVQQLCYVGYDSAICKSRWDALGWLPGGAHEYIDVCGKDSTTYNSHGRVIIDIEFSELFEIARPTRRYKAMFELLPDVFIGKAGRLDQILTIMCEAAKFSLKKRHIHLPPWRTLAYMQAKWFSSYTRTPINAYLFEDADGIHMQNCCRIDSTSRFQEKASLRGGQTGVAGRISELEPSRANIYCKAHEKDTHLSNIDEGHSKRCTLTYENNNELDVKQPKPSDRHARLPDSSTGPGKPPNSCLQSDMATNERLVSKNNPNSNAYKKLPEAERADLEEILSKLRQNRLCSTATIVYAK